MATRTARRRRPPDNDADNNDAVLKDLLVRELQDLYDADKQLIGAFGRLARAAEARPVVKLCREGVSYTKERVRRLDRVFTLIEMPARGRRCDGMRGLIRNAIQRAQENRVHAITDVES